MKKIMFIGLTLILFGLSLNNLKSATLIKLWLYGSSTQRSWIAQYEDEWGGMNYWCVGPGTGCGEWDWKAVYQLETQQNPTPPESRTPEYGHGLVTKSAEEKNIHLPPLSLPVYEEQWTN
jgi:hypothetical protein